MAYMFFILSFNTDHIKSVLFWLLLLLYKIKTQVICVAAALVRALLQNKDF